MSSNAIGNPDNGGIIGEIRVWLGDTSSWDSQGLSSSTGHPSEHKLHCSIDVRSSKVFTKKNAVTSKLTISPGVLDDLCGRSLHTLPMTVTSLHSPGWTPDSKLPVGRMNATPLVVRPSCSRVGSVHIGALTWIKRDTWTALSPAYFEEYWINSSYLW